MDHQPARIGHIYAVGLKPWLVNVADTELCCLKPSLARQVIRYCHLLRIYVDAGGMSALARRPTGDVTKSAAELDKTVAGSEPGAHQQFVGAIVMNFADHVEPVVITSSRAEDVSIAEGCHSLFSLSQHCRRNNYHFSARANPMPSPKFHGPPARHATHPQKPNR